MPLKRVLTVVDEGDPDRDERLLDHVIDIAGPAEATVYVGHVFTREEYDQITDRAGMETGVGGNDPTDLAKRHGRVQPVRDRLAEAGVEHEVRGAIGDHAPTIIEMAEEIDADLVVIGGTARSPTSKAVFGDIAQQVLLNAPCPVTYVRVQPGDD